MNLSPRFLALGLAAMTLAPAATAQEWGVRFGKRTRGGHVSVHVGSRGYGVDLTRGRRIQHAPPRHVHGPACQTPGHYETVREQVWVPGWTERVWVPAQVEVTYDYCGRRIERVVCPARWEYVQHPGCHEWRERRVWVPASYHCNAGGITAYPPRRRR